MPHWAEIDKNNKVLRITYGEGSDAESHQWLVDNLGGNWVRTYYATPGYTYAGIGYTYDPNTKNFLPPESHNEPIMPTTPEETAPASVQNAPASGTPLPQSEDTADDTMDNTTDDTSTTDNKQTSSEDSESTHESI